MNIAQLLVFRKCFARKLTNSQMLINHTDGELDLWDFYVYMIFFTTSYEDFIPSINAICIAACLSIISIVNYIIIMINCGAACMFLLLLQLHYIKLQILYRFTMSIGIELNGKKNMKSPWDFFSAVIFLWFLRDSKEVM